MRFKIVVFDLIANPNLRHSSASSKNILNLIKNGFTKPFFLFYLTINVVITICKVIISDLFCSK
jgi:hypothetical protein